MILCGQSSLAPAFALHDRRMVEAHPIPRMYIPPRAIFLALESMMSLMAGTGIRRMRQ